ncbi:MAG: hypothetical protein NT079_02860, partial [Candidatus Omnitrophica bacterium]|nr:hypothetical protein [Candidatus Omnitrophota bacterium]
VNALVPAQEENINLLGPVTIPVRSSQSAEVKLAEMNIRTFIVELNALRTRKFTYVIFNNNMYDAKDSFLDEQTLGNNILYVYFSRSEPTDYVKIELGDEGSINVTAKLPDGNPNVSLQNQAAQAIEAATMSSIFAVFSNADKNEFLAQGMEAIFVKKGEGSGVLDDFAKAVKGDNRLIEKATYYDLIDEFTNYFVSNAITHGGDPSPRVTLALYQDPEGKKSNIYEATIEQNNISDEDFDVIVRTHAGWRNAKEKGSEYLMNEDLRRSTGLLKKYGDGFNFLGLKMKQFPVYLEYERGPDGKLTTRVFVKIEPLKKDGNDQPLQEIRTPVSPNLPDYWKWPEVEPKYAHIYNTR